MCHLYTAPTDVWPKQQFPSGHPAVNRLGHRERLAAKTAWNYFENVEAHDAAVRVKLGATGGVIPPAPARLWYQFSGEEQRILYEKGRRYHILICPTLNWIPQREYPIPTTIVDNVLPEDCPCVAAGTCVDSDTEPIIRSLPPAPQPRSLPRLPSQRPLGRSATLIKEGIPTSVISHNKITLVENTPSTPRSAATPESAGTPTSTGSPYPPASPRSITKPAPTLNITEIKLPAKADRIQLT